MTQKELLTRLIARDWDAKRMAKFLMCTPATARNRAKRHGLKILSPAEIKERRREEVREAVKQNLRVKGYKVVDNFYWVDPKGEKVYRDRKERLTLSQPKKSIKKYGYKRIGFRGKGYYLHRLVYIAFYGEIPEGMTVDHKDGNRLNNHYKNLQLLTQADNSRKTMNESHAANKFNKKAVE